MKYYRIAQASTGLMLIGEYDYAPSMGYWGVSLSPASGSDNVWGGYADSIRDAYRMATTYLAATDGRILATITDDGSQGPVACELALANGKILAPDDVKAMVATMKPKETAILDNGMFTGAVVQGKALATLDGKYPNAGNVWPAGSGEITVRVNPDLLIALLKAADSCATAGVDIIVRTGELVPIEVRATNGAHQFRGLIMPISRE